MKKKGFIVLLACLVAMTGFISFIIWDNNRILATITLDINPSIKISLGKNEMVKKIEALNDDAKDIISNNLKGKKLDEGLDIITNNLIDRGYVKDRQVVVLLYTTGDISNQKMESKIKTSFSKKDVYTDIIIVDKVTKEDEKLADKYNITLAKAAYINSIKKEFANIDDSSLKDKSIQELLETKNRGVYCQEDYFLEGDFCLKEVDRIKPQDGMVCPVGYYEYEGVCYEETGSLDGDKLQCRDEFILNGKKCTRTNIIDGEPSKYRCEQGEEKTRGEMNLTDKNAADANQIVCVDLSNATHPVTPCELPADDPTERTMVGGVCYWHRAPVIESGCPGKIEVDGFCWDNASSILICAGYRDGRQYSSRDEYCEHSIRYIDPVVTEYKCPKGFTLAGDKCVQEEVEDAYLERVCPNGYTLVNDGRCINRNKTTEKENGFICNQENSKLDNNVCIIYDIVEVIHN